MFDKQLAIGFYYQTLTARNESIEFLIRLKYPSILDQT